MNFLAPFNVNHNSVFSLIKMMFDKCISLIPIIVLHKFFHRGDFSRLIFLSFVYFKNNQRDHGIIVVNVLSKIAFFVLLTQGYVGLYFPVYSEIKHKIFLKIFTFNFEGRVMEILMNIINSEIGIIFTKIFDRHPENPIIFVWPITLFFELGSPFITFIRPGSRPFIWSPRISELDNSFILSLFVYNSLSV